ncbi:YdbH family protein [Morganella morganii]|uniref:YdbH family protein n=1 Tax=Morganella morganii TaxID=582 RepID=UPI000C9CECF2|nr:YdbH family protein [Morganella morganii]AUR31436.1 YdbH family protein [Morganella morganii]HDS5614732.1 YdbH family protein [Morganella morganii subsp. morganii]
MKKLLKVLVVLLVLLMIILPAAWLTIPRWLPAVVKSSLPDGVTLSLSQPKIRAGGLYIEEAVLRSNECQLAGGEKLSLHYQRGGRWIIDAGSLTGDADCFQKLPSGPEETDTTPVDIGALLSQLPPVTLTADNVIPAPWQMYRGKLSLTTAPGRGQQLSYQGENIQAELAVDPALNLTLSQLDATIGDEKFALSGALTLPLNTAELPDKGRLQAEITTTYRPQPLMAAFDWQGRQGVLTLSETDPRTVLLNIPWEATAESILIKNGEWRWDEWEQPLKGTISAELKNWLSSPADMLLGARISVTTQGVRGKGTVVLQLPETPLPLTEFDIPFELAGQVNHNDMWAAGRVPAVLTGTFSGPVIRLRSGALVRARGQLSPDFLVEELRLPLAGTSLSQQGISGPLDAIVTVNNPELGRYRFQMKGQAREFLPDNGRWYWQIWGKGRMKPLNADWTFSGAGSWLDEEIRIRKLNTGFNGIRYGMMSMDAPALTLLSPLIWTRVDGQEKLSGKVQLTTRKIRLDNSYLPSATFDMTLEGRAPRDFSVKGTLSAGKNIGPIHYWSRWDGVRLRGEARWPEQDMRAFQTLIPADLGITLRNGVFYAQAAYSAAPDQGFVAGGHWVVKQAGMWLKDGEVSGVDFVLPWRLADSRWQLGSKTPVMLRIARVENLFEVTDIKADLQGYYPYDDVYPLELSGVSLDILGGQVTMPSLTIPQKTAAVIKLDKLNTGPLINTLKVTQFALEGSISGELPFYIDNPQWIVHNGWVENDEPLTLNLDNQFVESVSENNISAGTAINWLDYLVMKRVRTDVNLTNLGVLTMSSVVSGYNPVLDARRAVNLNYRHEENVFQLWRSLRFGSNLEAWLEKSISQNQE